MFLLVVWCVYRMLREKKLPKDWLGKLFLLGFAAVFSRALFLVFIFGFFLFDIKMAFFIGFALGFYLLSIKFFWDIIIYIGEWAETKIPADGDGLNRTNLKLFLLRLICYAAITGLFILVCRKLLFFF